MSRSKRGRSPAPVENRPAEPRQRVQIEKIQRSAEFYSGPLPSPDMFRGYEEVSPGAADRILRMAESEAAHRHNLDNRLVTIHGITAVAGVIVGGLLGLAGIGGGVYIAVQGASLEGAGLALLSLSTLVGVFIFQQRSGKGKGE